MTSFILRLILEKMVKKNNSQLVTKKDLHLELKVFRQEFGEFREEMRVEIETSNKKYFDKLATMIDPVLKEVIASREERQIEAARLSELRDIAEDHESRITDFEKLQKAA